MTNQKSKTKQTTATNTLKEIHEDKNSKKKKKKKNQNEKQKQKKHKKETHCIFPINFSHVVYLFPHQNFLRKIHLRY